MKLSELKNPPTEEQWLRTTSWAWAVPANPETPLSPDRERFVVVNGRLKALEAIEYNWRLLGVKVKGAAA